VHTDPAALITGRHSVRTGCTTVLPGAGLVAWEETIADRLKTLGYNNAIYGKWRCGESEGRYPTDNGFDYWYGINGTWDYCTWVEDKWFAKEDLEPEHVMESTGPGELKEVKVLSPAVKQTIDLEFLEKAGQWMEDSVSKDEPFFVYFNHSLVHFPTVAREEYQGTSNGGEVADCLQQLDGDFQTLLDKIEDGAAPIQKLATPHIYNLTVNPDENTPYNYSQLRSWLMFEIFAPKTMELQASLEKDSVPFGAPLDYNPYEKKGEYR
jgi:arylsulfatase